jgi:hypothetical protein
VKFPGAEGKTITGYLNRFDDADRLSSVYQEAAGAEIAAFR